MRWLLALFVVFVAGVTVGFREADAPTSSYQNGAYGFKITPPAFSGSDSVLATPVIFAATPEQEFAANVNVQVQHPGTEFEEYKKGTIEQSAALGLKIDSQKDVVVGELPAVEWNLIGKLAGRELRFLTRVIKRDNTYYVITCTALAENFESYEVRFRACLDSFQFIGEK